MNNYEILILINPMQGERLQNVIRKYKFMIESKKGKINKLEDLGKKHLSYQIKNIYKAHYILINIKCNTKVLKEIFLSFRFNDTIVRSFILKKKKIKVK